MSSIWKFLAEIGKIPPAAYDAIFPHGPIDAVLLAGSRVRYVDVAHRVDPGALVGFNPQPLPPREAAVGAALVGSLLHGAIIVVGGRDQDPGSTFLSEIEDWCGTGWPKKWPKPKPKGWDQNLMFTGAALYAANLASQYDHNPPMQEALGSAAEQLMGQVG